MADKPVTREYLDKSLDKLGVMIAKGFNENTEQHRKIFKVLNEHTERLNRIETKLEGVVYRREFDELKERVDELENLLAIKKT